MVYVANFCKDLVAREKTATIREMYYVSEGWGISFKTQQESNIVGEDLEVTLGTTREDLGLMPEEDGATAMDVGKTFSKKYLKQAAENGTDNFISPDSQIDASTCFLPERTWFIKNIYHKDFPNVVDGLFNEIINNEDFTVNSDENYPQYLVYNKTDAGETLLPMTDENMNTDEKYNVSFFRALGNLFKALFRVIKNSKSK